VGFCGTTSPHQLNTTHRDRRPLHTHLESLLLLTGVPDLDLDLDLDRSTARPGAGPPRLLLGASSSGDMSLPVGNGARRVDGEGERLLPPPPRAGCGGEGDRLRCLTARGGVRDRLGEGDRRRLRPASSTGAAARLSGVRDLERDLERDREGDREGDRLRRGGVLERERERESSSRPRRGGGDDLLIPIALTSLSGASSSILLDRRFSYPLSRSRSRSSK